MDVCEPLQNVGLGILNLVLFKQCCWGNGYSCMLWRGKRCRVIDTNYGSMWWGQRGGGGGAAGVPIANKGHTGFASGRA